MKQLLLKINKFKLEMNYDTNTTINDLKLFIYDKIGIFKIHQKIYLKQKLINDHKKKIMNLFDENEKNELTITVNLVC